MEITANIGPSANNNTTDPSDDPLLSDEMYACKILIVDDELLIRELIKSYLNSAGFNDTIIAEDGLTGVRRISDADPDLVILDIEMPGINGIEVLEIVRANSKFDDIPIIVQSAHEETEFRNEVLRAGATILISKPIDFDLLLDRVRNLLQHRLLVQSLKSYQKRVQQELEAARSMQMQLLPREREIEKIEHKYGVTIDWHYQPSSELSGDCWGVHSIDDHKFGIFIVDFTGHGVGSAVNTFRLHTIMGDTQLSPNSPGEYLMRLNKQLIELIPRGQFATMNYSIVDVEANTLTFASAGHTSPIFGKMTDEKMSLGDPSGVPLGIIRTAEYTDHEISFDPDNILFLYSDALIETPGEHSPPLEDDGLIELVGESLALPATKKPLQWLLNIFYARSKILPDDDVTAVWIQRQN